jgi:hypothetical protein
LKNPDVLGNIHNILKLSVLQAYAVPQKYNHKYNKIQGGSPVTGEIDIFL